MIFFFYGPNTYSARQKLSQMVAAYIKKNGSDYGIERIEGEKTTPQALIADLTAVPFLANSRLVIVEELSKNKSAASEVGRILSKIPETTNAVFYDPEPDQRTTYFKTMLKSAKPAKFEKLSSVQLSAWIKQEVKKLETTIDQPAINLLIEMVGDDQWRMEQELAKLANYSHQITADAVREMVEVGPGQNIFDLVDAIIGGKLSRALSIYRKMLAERTNEIYILTMIIWQLRNLLLAKTAGPLTPGELAARTGMSPYVAGKVMTKQRELREDLLKAAFLSAVEADYMVKSGKGDPDYIVERLIYKISA